MGCDFQLYNRPLEALTILRRAPDTFGGNEVHGDFDTVGLVRNLTKNVGLVYHGYDDGAYLMWTACWNKDNIAYPLLDAP